MVAVTSGANMNFDRLRLVTDLCNFGLRTEAMLSCTIPEHAGAFRAFIDTLYGDADVEAARSSSDDGAAAPPPRAALDVTEFKYRYSVDRDAKILISISAADPGEVAAAVARLNGRGRFACTDVTDNGLAQVHLRHMVGGRPRSYSGAIEDERMVVVTFPERSGALRLFLAQLADADDGGGGLNVTMFHYRATGNRASSVLLGLQVPAAKVGAFDAMQAALQPYDFTFDELDRDTQELFDEFVS